MIPAGVAFVMTGARPNTGFLPGAALNKNGAVAVDRCLRATGPLGTRNEVYALGDCAATGDIMLAYAAGEQAK
jgi:NADPH-dependent 2,4-dienoyl-CoA reductase/sulfur reductase-like enzyme